ncbi:hypothetical protein OAO38_04730 [Candidatus Pelagibacter ubique]|nr:hypothetical protein [Candidatus Pelagibacter ubique]
MKKNFFNSNFLIVGLARNCGKVINKQVNKINEAFIETASTKWLIVESDSDDNTIEELNSLSHKLNLKYVSLGVLRDKYPKRTERISVCRNYYLSEIDNNSDYDYVDYVVVVDLDGVNLELTHTSLKTCWEQKVDWDVCFANQSAPYYDIRALRHETWSPNDCWENSQFLINNGMSQFSAESTAVWSRMILIDIRAQPIEVDSAFGGLGIYKKNVITDCRYSGLNKNRNEICEHVSFNMQIKNKGYKLYIMPTLINGGWNEHNSNLKIYKRINKKLYYYIIKFVTIFISKQKLKNYLEKLLNLTGR